MPTPFVLAPGQVVHLLRAGLRVCHPAMIILAQTPTRTDLRDMYDDSWHRNVAHSPNQQGVVASTAYWHTSEQCMAEWPTLPVAEAVLR